MTTAARPRRGTSAAPEASAPAAPPHDVEAEIAVLGSMLLDPEAADVAIAALRREDFYLPLNADVFQVLAELYDGSRAVDVVLLREELQRRGILEKVGGTGFLSRVMSSVPTAANIVRYCTIVSELATLREVIVASERVTSAARSRAPIAKIDALIADLARIVRDSRKRIARVA